ncbi:MAG: serine hydrolase [Verrucomicrobia bacterium]|nr:serine hydrolase [Verrucomicrobiota bacterium]
MKRSPLALCALLTTSSSTPAADYSAGFTALEEVIHQQMTDWNIGGIAVALVDDQRLVYWAGFGEAKRNSVFRVGSISKLFNAIAVMQQVEAGKLALDAPLPAYVLPLNPFPGAPDVTLRQILCHRSGLQRESPVGGYFDVSQPGLAATLASLRRCVLVTHPGEKTRYSNVAPSLAGHLVERASGQRFERYQRAHLFDPLGMTSSAWTLARALRERIVVSHMRVADGRGGWKRRPAPLFDLGTLPAGNLFSTADDLARFASALLADGGGLVKPETLREMWRPQLTQDSEGFGLGFSVGKFRGHRTISHSGAVYGCSSLLVLLPEEKLAAIVLCNEDVANGRIHHIGDTALSLLLAAKLGEKAPPPVETLPTKDLVRFVGHYESQSFWAHLVVCNGRLCGDISGQPTEFVPAGGLSFTGHSRIDDGVTVTFERDEQGGISGFKYGLIQHFTAVPANPPSLPREWRIFLGSYGPDFIPLVVSERHGHLYAMTENMVDYRLTPMNRHVCALPPGMYADEQAVFLTDTRGRPHSVNFANMLLRRRK